MSKVVFVHGSYYNKNFGDYLLINRVLKELKNTNEVVLPFSKEKVRIEFGTSTRKVKLSDFFNAKLCIFGGGGYLGEPPKSINKWSINFLWRHFLPFLLMKMFGIEVKIIGAGFGPISKFWLRPFVSYMLKNSSIVCLRDSESIQYAKDVNPKITYTLVTDLAQDKDFLNSLCLSENCNFEKYIAVHAGLQLNDEYADNIISKLVELHELGYKIKYFADSPSHNNEVCAKGFLFNVSDDLNINFIEYVSPEDTLKIIKESSGVITGKLHVGIVGSTYGLPVLSIPLHHKTIRYYRDVERVNVCCLKDAPLEQFLDCLSSFSNDIKYNNCFQLPDNVLNRHKLAMKIIRGN